MARRGGYTVPYDEDAYERAIRQRIRMNARKGREARWFAEDESRRELAVTITNRGYDRPDSFFGRLAESLNEWGSLTPNQEAAVRRILAEDEARKAARHEEEAKSEWVGEVGKRLDFELTVKFVTSYEGAYGTTYVHGFRDAAGNTLVHKGSWLGLEKGQVVKLKATVKDHSTYQGVKQTLLARPKVEAEKEDA